MTSETILTDKAQILARLAASRRALQAALDRAGPGLLEHPATWGEWTLKDLLPHIIYCQTVAIDRLQKVAAGRADEITGLSGDAEMNQENENVYRSNKDRPLAEMLDLFQWTHHSLVTAVKQIPASLYAENPATGPTRLADIVAGDGYGHDEEHLADVEKAIDSNR
jgi:hypothetical protein